MSIDFSPVSPLLEGSIFWTRTKRSVHCVVVRAAHPHLQHVPCATVTGKYLALTYAKLISDSISRSTVPSAKEVHPRLATTVVQYAAEKATFHATP